MLKQSKNFPYGQTFNYAHGHLQSANTKTYFLFTDARNTSRIKVIVSYLLWDKLPCTSNRGIAFPQSSQVQNHSFLKVTLQVFFQDCYLLKQIQSIIQTKALTGLQEKKNIVKLYAR